MTKTYIISAAEDHISLSECLRESGLDTDSDEGQERWETLRLAIINLVDEHQMNATGSDEAIRQSDEGTYQAMGWQRADPDDYSACWDVDVAGMLSSL